MKKALIGIGIGCGVLVLLGIGAVVAGGFWVKSKVGGAVEAAQDMEVRQKELKQLDAQFPFTAPKEGELLALQEEQLKRYFEVRKAAMPVFKSFEAKSKEFEAKHKNTEGKPDISAAFEAGGMLVQLTADLQKNFVENLRAQKMSAREFHHITAAVYASQLGAMVNAAAEMNKQARQGMKETVARLEKEAAEATDPQVKSALETQVAELKKQVETEAPAADEAQQAAEAQKPTIEANKALLAKYEEDVKQYANPGFDALMGGGDQMAEAFKQMPGSQAGQRDHDSDDAKAEDTSNE